MNIDDFRYVRCGQQLLNLTPEELSLLHPADQKGPGKQRAMLVLHGFSSTPAVYRCFIPHLTQYDAIVCPALAGHADSVALFSTVKATDWEAAAAKICASLLSEYQRVDVLGLSLGGLIACKLSAQFKLNHLFLLAPALILNMNIPLMLKVTQVASFLGFRFLRNGAGSLLNSEYNDIAYRRLPINTIQEMLRLAQSHQWVAPSCPVDLFLGAYDEVVSSKQIEQLFAPLPHAKTHWMSQSAHILPLDNDRMQIINTINQYT